MLLFNILMMSGWAYVFATTVVAMMTPALEKSQVTTRAGTEQLSQHRSCRAREVSYHAGVGHEFLSDRSRRHAHTNISQTLNNNQPHNTHRNHRHSRPYVADHQHVRSISRRVRAVPWRVCRRRLRDIFRANDAAHRMLAALPPAAHQRPRVRSFHRLVCDKYGPIRVRSPPPLPPAPSHSQKSTHVVACADFSPFNVLYQLFRFRNPASSKCSRLSQPHHRKFSFRRDDEASCPAFAVF